MDVEVRAPRHYLYSRVVEPVVPHGRPRRPLRGVHDERGSPHGGALHAHERAPGLPAEPGREVIRPDHRRVGGIGPYGDRVRALEVGDGAALLAQHELHVQGAQLLRDLPSVAAVDRRREIGMVALPEHATVQAPLQGGEPRALDPQRRHVADLDSLALERPSEVVPGRSEPGQCPGPLGAIMNVVSGDVGDLHGPARGPTTASSITARVARAAAVQFSRDAYSWKAEEASCW